MKTKILAMLTIVLTMNVSAHDVNLMSGYETNVEPSSYEECILINAKNVNMHVLKRLLPVIKQMCKNNHPITGTKPGYFRIGGTRYEVSNL